MKGIQEFSGLMHEDIDVFFRSFKDACLLRRVSDPIAMLRFLEISMKGKAKSGFSNCISEIWKMGLPDELHYEAMKEAMLICHGKQRIVSFIWGDADMLVKEAIQKPGAEDQEEEIDLMQHDVVSMNGGEFALNDQVYDAIQEVMVDANAVLDEPEDSIMEYVYTHAGQDVKVVCMQSSDSDMYANMADGRTSLYEASYAIAWNAGDKLLNKVNLKMQSLRRLGLTMQMVIVFENGVERTMLHVFPDSLARLYPFDPGGKK